MAHTINRISPKKKKSLQFKMGKQGGLFLFKIKVPKVGVFFLGVFFFCFLFLFGLFFVLLGFFDGGDAVIGFGLVFYSKKL